MKGFTLIEILISISLSLVVLSTITTIYYKATYHFEMQTHLLQVQENSLIFTDLIRSELQRRGNIGCLKLTKNVKLDTNINFRLTMNNQLRSYQGEHKDQSDGFTVRYKHPHSTPLIDNMSDVNTLMVASGNGFKKGDVVIVSNCRQGEIFKILKLHQTTHGVIVYSEFPLHHRYHKGSEVALYVVNSYFLTATKRLQQNKPVYALFQKNINQENKELVEGIETMIIHYLVRENGVLKEYASDSVPDFSKVNSVSLKISFSPFKTRFPQSLYLYVTLPL